MKICHFTSVHTRYDTRIFLKECRSLAHAGYETILVVADGNGDEEKDGVSIRDVGKGNGRIDRILNVTRRVLRKAISINADIYHFHDPELIPAGLKLKRLGKQVIFDSHEDVPKQLLSKPYLNKPAKLVLSRLIGVYEYWACRRFDAIVAATPYIRDKFLKINERTVDINNFPMCGELASNYGWQNKQPTVCYIGGISEARGIRELVQALGCLESNARLELVGRFSEHSIESEVRSYPGWSRVDALGFVDRAGVREVLARSIAGLVTFHSAPNHIDAQPNKMFEYMSAGIPVIGSDFPLWREIIHGNNCGKCVDPLNPMEIAQAMDFFIDNPDVAKQMGENGQKAVREKYNWLAEERKLMSLYNRLCR